MQRRSAWGVRVTLTAGVVCCCCGFLEAAAAAALGTAWFPSWRVTGSTTVRGEYYDARGDSTSSPYTNEGGQGYGEF